MFRRTLVDAGLRFDDRLGTLEDIDFWIQCSLRTRFLRVPVVTCRVRPTMGTSGTSGSTGNVNLDQGTLQGDGAIFEAKWLDTERQLRESPTGLLYRGRRFIAAGDYASARPLLERAYAQCPTDVNILNLLGLTRHHEGESASGLLLIRQALLLAPGHHGLLQNQELLSAACRKSMVVA